MHNQSFLKNLSHRQDLVKTAARSYFFVQPTLCGPDFWHESWGTVKTYNIIIHFYSFHLSFLSSLTFKATVEPGSCDDLVFTLIHWWLQKKKNKRKQKNPPKKKACFNYVPGFNRLKYVPMCFPELRCLPESRPKLPTQAYVKTHSFFGGFLYKRCVWTLLACEMQRSRRSTMQTLYACTCKVEGWENFKSYWLLGRKTRQNKTKTNNTNNNYLLDIEKHWDAKGCMYKRISRYAKCPSLT